MQAQVVLGDPQATARLGECIGKNIEVGDVLLLVGDLGTGKTTMTQAIAQGMQISDRVTSPTFTLINEYHGGEIPLFHLDLYRLSEEQADNLGIWEYEDRGVLVVEWAERLANRPQEYLELHLYHQGEGRKVEFHPHGKRPQQLMEKIQQCWS